MSEILNTEKGSSKLVWNCFFFWLNGKHSSWKDSVSLKTTATSSGLQAMLVFRVCLGNWFKYVRSWRLTRFSLVISVGMNFRPRYSRVICLSVSCSLDRFLIYCFCVSMALQKHFLSLIFLHSFLFLLRFLAALFFLQCVFSFPLSSKESD